MPSFTLERQMEGLVAGIDEAGRGPLAGPVVAAAVIIERRSLPRGLSAAIDDSKKLTAQARAEIYERLVGLPGVHMAVGQASVAEIDSINILQATFLAMNRAVAALPCAPAAALIDGNLVPRGLPCPGRAVVKGDSLSLCIAAASIVAKVTRDRLMAALAQEHPPYGWERNAGYGTPEHRAAIQRFGPTPYHRMSFSPFATPSLFDALDEGIESEGLIDPQDIVDNDHNALIPHKNLD